MIVSVSVHDLSMVTLAVYADDFALLKGRVSFLWLSCVFFCGLEATIPFFESSRKSNLRLFVAWTHKMVQANFTCVAATVAPRVRHRGAGVKPAQHRFILKSV